MKKTTFLLALLFICISSRAEEARIPYIANTPQEAYEIPQLLQQHHVKYHTLTYCNWKEYPYKPFAQFAMAYTPSAIIIAYRAKEYDIRAQYTQDQDPVFKDACMEFFIQPADDSIYYNFECNCLGYILMQAGTTTRPRDEATQAILKNIKRWTSISREQIRQAGKKATSWEVALIIPYTSFYMHHIHSLAGKNVRANVYKCGGTKQYTHYVSWSPIKTPKPNFHTPEYFGQMTFIAP